MDILGMFSSVQRIEHNENNDNAKAVRWINPAECFLDFSRENHRHMHLETYVVQGIRMQWTVLFHSEFVAEFAALPQPVRVELSARLVVLKEFGPTLGRPNVDTLNGSSFANMKELRFQLDGIWRFAFAFDPQRQAIILVGGNKEGQRQRAFYKELIRIADQRFAAHVASFKLEAKK
ncbi:MAG TPA: type II toxin-antitoxin system RelE/ParE family toxin [Xanthobacteraceae bacterium]|nr:type II toxin-antitoxin system RelE/ParE family toxin [Xanthobacteraceae bacterium]